MSKVYVIPFLEILLNIRNSSMKSYHWFSRPENRLRDFWQFQILALTLAVLWPWVNQSLKRILRSESTAKRSALQGCCSVLNGTRKAPAPASAILLALGRHRDRCSLQGRDMCLALVLPSSLQALTKIVQCLPDSCLCCSLVAQSCLTLRNPLDCSPPGSSIHWISQARNIRVGCHFLLQGIFLTQGLNPSLPHWQADSLSHSCCLVDPKRHRSLIPPPPEILNLSDSQFWTQQEG